MTNGGAHNRQIAEILDGFGEAFIAFDFSWRISHCNRAAEAHFGFRREEVQGRVIWDLVPGRGSALFQFLEGAMQSRTSADVEMPSDIQPGRLLGMRAFPLEGGLGVSFRDVTARREALRREREQAEHLELALAASGLGDWSWDAASDVVTFSTRAADIWGIPAGPYMTWTEMQGLLHPDDRERARLAVESAMIDRTSYEIEYRVTRPTDGAERWVTVRAHGTYADDGSPVGMVGVVGDISRAKTEEARLGQLERRHHFLLEVADTLRDIDDPAEIMATISRMLGERMAVARAGFAEVGEDGQQATVGESWSAPRLPNASGAAFSLAAFGPKLMNILKAGRIVRVDDVRADERVPAPVRAFDGLTVHAILIVPLIRGGRLNAFFALTSETPRVWTEEEVSLTREVAVRTWSSWVRAHFERALRESEARFRAMADSAPAPIWLTDANGAMEFVNRAFAEILGAPAEQLFGDAWAAYMHPEDAPRVAALRAEHRAVMTGYEFPARFRRQDGEWRWMHATSQPRFDASGEFLGYVGIATDVTEQRRAEGRQRLLINELNHRVKNTLATVQSLAHQTLREGVVTREARQMLTDRLLALSAAHNVLTRQNWEGADVLEVVQQAIRPYDDPQRRKVETEGPSVRVAPNVALALALALHELATNAVKYGALSAAEGRVTLEWRRTDGAFELEWREHGGPPVEEPARRGFGSRLLSQGLAAELGAPAEVRFEPAGLVCRVRAPLA